MENTYIERYKCFFMEKLCCQNIDKGVDKSKAEQSSYFTQWADKE